MKVNAFVASGLMAFCAATSAEQSEHVRLAFDIQSKGLEAALTDFALATNLQVLFQSDIVPNRLAPRVSGSLTPRAALEQLLANSGLRYQFVNERTVTIRPVDDAGTGIAGGLEPTGSGYTTRSTQGLGDSFRIAQAVPAEPQSPAADRVRDEGKAIPEVLIKGARTLNTDVERTPDDAQPYVVFDRQAIERSSASTIDRFLRDQLTSANGQMLSSQGSSGANNSLFDLRGLGSGQTLILVDGHRVASLSGNGNVGQPDINGIPLAAIERIEVLPATASGIYGGGATGGAINIIRRRDYSGAEAKVAYLGSFAGGGAERRVDMAGGINLEGGRTNILFSASYTDTQELLAQDRNLVERGRAHILAVNPNGILGAANLPPLGRTTNIASNNGQNLTLKPAFGGGSLQAPRTSVPVGYAGPASDNGAGLIANAGTYNLDLADTVQVNGGRRALLSAPTVKSASVTARREFLPWLEGFVDLSVSRNEGEYAASGVTGTFILQPTAPSNPFNEAIRVTTPAFGTEQMSSVKYDDRRGVAGLIFRLPADWHAETDFTWNKTSVSASSTASSMLSAGATTAVNSGQIDVFRDVNAYPVDFSEYLSAPTITLPSDTILRDTAVRVAGPLPWELPGGAPTVTFLLEYRKETLDDYTITSPLFTSIAYERSQSTKSAYAEARLPIVSARNGIPALYSLDLELKVRRDEYDIDTANRVTVLPGGAAAPEVRLGQSLSSTDPTYGISLRPIPDVMFRASYGTGFLPPALTQLVPSADQSNPGTAFTDPRRGNQPLGPVTILSGGNPDLRPEKSHSRSVGLVLYPRFVPELRISADWVQIRKQDNTTQFPLSQANIANELLIPGLIKRGPPSDGFDVGPITTFNGRWLNASLQEVEAVDLAVNYRFQTDSWGTFSFGGAATRNLKNVTQVVSTAPEIESVETAGALKWNARASLGWEMRRWQVVWDARYYDSYYLLTSHGVVPNQGSATVPSQAYHDVTARYRIEGNAGISLLSNTEFQLGIRNVFDKEPPVIAADPYYSTFGDPRLASYFLSVKKSFF
jgi:iron complex outermembrane receptor protein